MLDPTPVPPWLCDAVHPLTSLLHLHTLPLHIHEVLLSFGVFSLIYLGLSPYISARLLGNKYSKFPPRTKLHWNMHVVAFLNSIFLSIASLYVLYADKDRLNATWEDRIWGYTGAGGFVQAIGAGYFLWDVQVCLTNFNTLGVLDLAHAIVALTIATLGFRPFGLYYGIQYTLIELSTPFVNIHWFLNKLDLAGSKLQIVNGVILITTFGCCRLIWGSYLTFVFFRDVWTALHERQPSWTQYSYSPSQKPLVLEHKATWWLAAMFFISNAVIMTLSAFWFMKMIKTIQGHFNAATREEKASSHVKED